MESNARKKVSKCQWRVEGYFEVTSFLRMLHVR